MNKYIKAVFCVPLAGIKYAILKMENGGRFHAAFPAIMSPMTEVTVNGKSELRIAKKLKMHNGAKIRVRKGGKLEIGTTGMGTVLATITLDATAGTTSGGVLTFSSFPKSDSSADATGTAAAARIRTSVNADVVTGLTVGTSGTDVILDSTSITSGQVVTINSATITHG